MEPRISLITLGVPDLKRSTAFYRDGLGLPGKESGENIVFFLPCRERGSPCTPATTWPTTQGSGFPGFILAHNVHTREEVDALLEKAVKAGGTLVKPGKDVFWGGYSGYFADPDGFLWEVAWNPHFDIE